MRLLLVVLSIVQVHSLLYSPSSPTKTRTEMVRNRTIYKPSNPRPSPQQRKPHHVATSKITSSSINSKLSPIVNSQRILPTPSSTSKSQQARVVAGNSVRRSATYRAPSRNIATSSMGGALPPLPPSQIRKNIAVRAIPEKESFLKERKSVPPVKYTSLAPAMPGTRPEPPRTDLEWFWFKPAQKYIDALNLSKKRIRAEPLPRFHFTDDRLRRSNLPFGTELVARRI